MNRSVKRIALLLILAIISAVLGFGASYVLKKVDAKYPWVWMYLKDQLPFQSKEVAEGPKHIMFLFVDHFEPFSWEDIDRWAKEYPEFARKHQDADGVHPQHSFFWMFFEANEEESIRYLRALSKLSYEGFGEVERHQHHDEDTEVGLTQKMEESIRLSNLSGAFITAEPRPRKTFGFIHGRWALDNSRGDKSCGVNNELIVLRKLGCYADFTHPSWGRMHPSMINRFYYATDDPLQPKSYDTGAPMEVGKPGVGDLLLMTGQSVVRFKGLKPDYDHGEVDHNYLPTPERIDAWVQNAVTIKGRPEWLFIKVFTHGCIQEAMPILLGEWRHKMHDYLEENYNDGEQYILHYVTARESYNIAKAAEAGETGNPHRYRDYLIPKYVNRHFYSESNFETLSFDKRQAVIKFLESTDNPVNVRIRKRNVTVTGDAEVLQKSEKDEETHLKLQLTGKGVVGFSYD